MYEGLIDHTLWILLKYTFDELDFVNSDGLASQKGQETAEDNKGLHR